MFSRNGQVVGSVLHSAVKESTAKPKAEPKKAESTTTTAKKAAPAKAAESKKEPAEGSDKS